MANLPPDRPTSGDLQDLAIAVEQLTEETRLLRQALDELRDDVVWAARQVVATGYQGPGTPAPDPRDPLAPDMFPSVAVPRRDAPTAAARAGDQPDESAESPYCCDRPRLAWHGDPDAPGVACETCGYVIAENGSVVIWRADDDEPAGEDSRQPEPRQGNLF